MRTRPLAIILENDKMASGHDEFVLIRAEFTDGNVKRLCNATSSIPFLGENYEPCDLRGSIIRAGSQGEMPLLAISLDDTDLGISGYVRRLRGASGSVVTIYGVNTVNLAAADFEVVYEMQNAEIDDRSQIVIFNLGAPNIFEERFLLQRYFAARCGHPFRGVECTVIDPTASKVIGEDAATYLCLIPHTSSVRTRPVTGTSALWVNYWRKIASGGVNSWLPDTLYTPGTATCGHTLEECRVYGVSRRYGGYVGLSDTKVQIV